jgi:hypothetical protein
MIVFVAAMMLAGADAGGDVRHDFVQCLKGALTQAKTQKMGVDGFVAFAKTTCASSESPFKASLVSADVSHGMSHKDSLSDAESQVSDYYSEWHDNYAAEAETPVSKPK